MNKSNAPCCPLEGQLLSFRAVAILKTRLHFF